MLLLCLPILLMAHTYHSLFEPPADLTDINAYPAGEDSPSVNGRLLTPSTAGRQAIRISMETVPFT